MGSGTPGAAAGADIARAVPEEVATRPAFDLVRTLKAIAELSEILENPQPITSEREATAAKSALMSVIDGRDIGILITGAITDLQNAARAQIMKTVHACPASYERTALSERIAKSKRSIDLFNEACDQMHFSVFTARPKQLVETFFEFLRHYSFQKQSDVEKLIISLIFTPESQPAPAALPGEKTTDTSPLFLHEDVIVSSILPPGFNPIFCSETNIELLQAYGMERMRPATHSRDAFIKWVTRNIHKNIISYDRQNNLQSGVMQCAPHARGYTTFFAFVDVLNARLAGHIASCFCNFDTGYNLRTSKTCRVTNLTRIPGCDLIKLIIDEIKF